MQIGLRILCKCVPRCSCFGGFARSRILHIRVIDVRATWYHEIPVFFRNETLPINAFGKAALDGSVAKMDLGRIGVFVDASTIPACDLRKTRHGFSRDCLSTLQGSGATGDCCSKCWREAQKKAETKAVAACKEVSREEEPTPMEIDTPVVAKPEIAETETTKAPAAEAPAATVPAKKKKKKASYKSMMAGMMKSAPTKDIEQEKEQLRKVTGGGAFSKIEKI